MSSSFGALFTIAGITFPATGTVLTPAIGPVGLFGTACDLWLDYSTNVTLSGGNLVSITDRSSNATVMTGSIPYNAAASGTHGGVSNQYGSVLANGFLSSAASAKSVYEWNKPFSISVAFIYGGHPAGNADSLLTGGWDPATAWGCGWALRPGGASVAFGGDKISVELKPYSASGADGNYVFVYGTTVLTPGTLYKVHMTYDGSGSAAGVKVWINDVAETMNILANTVLSSTWINTANPQPFYNFSPTAASSMYGTLLEVFTVSRQYTTTDLVNAEAWLDGRYA